MKKEELSSNAHRFVVQEPVESVKSGGIGFVGFVGFVGAYVDPAANERS